MSLLVRVLGTHLTEPLGENLVGDPFQLGEPLEPGEPLAEPGEPRNWFTEHNATHFTRKIDVYVDVTIWKAGRLKHQHNLF